MALGPIRDKPEGQPDDLQLPLQANARLIEQFKDIAESYQTSLGESRQLILELQKSLEISMGETVERGSGEPSTDCRATEGCNTDSNCDNVIAGRLLYGA
jgi:hypothetical protein